MDEIDLGWVRTLFLVGLTIVVLAQLLAFVLGPMTRSRLLSMLFGITPSDPVTLWGAATLLMIVALCASWIPARRAASVQPIEALRRD